MLYVYLFYVKILFVVVCFVFLDLFVRVSLIIVVVGGYFFVDVLVIIIDGGEKDGVNVVLFSNYVFVLIVFGVYFI